MSIKNIYPENSCLRGLVSVCLAMAISVTANAQFYSNGNDPASLHWYKTETPNYRLIYPSGLDSLARVYGRSLEKYRLSESISSGLVPGEGYRHRTPVILHSQNAIANGSVTWAPRRIDIYTTPSAYDPDPMPWVKSLAIHEGRHLAQMQFGYKGWLKPLTWILGDMAPGAYSAIWPNTWFLEGDAVTAETALTEYGRGRSADFLDYYMFAFDNGDRRNWYRWRYGSYRYYSPDHYALGYMTIAGTRYCFDDPLFTERYFHRLSRNPLRFLNTQKTISESSGMKFRESFDTIMDTFHDIWKDEAEMRKPFNESTCVQTGNKWFSEFYGSTPANGKLYGIISGIAESSWLAEYDPATGKARKVRAFSSECSGLKYADGKLWWSEAIPDERWSLKMSSRIRYYDLNSGKTGTLTRRGRFFNPDISDDGSVIAAIEYPEKGGSNLTYISAHDGRILDRTFIPDSLQAIEVCFIGDQVAISTISEGGYALFLGGVMCGNGWECISRPLPVSIRNLQEAGGLLWFSSDRDGTQELYSIDIKSGKIQQYTSLAYGGDEFCFIGDSLYFTALNKNGRLLHKTGIPAGKDIDFNDIHRYKIADRLTAQEKELAENKGLVRADDNKPETTFSKPERYRKPMNMFRFHSWAPIYFNYDNIRNSSGDYRYEKASLGATALFQNSLGTAWGSVGYSFHTDPYSSSYGSRQKYRHSGHILFTYTGLYPVFELSADINDRAAIQYSRRRTAISFISMESLQGRLLARPYLSATLKSYIPFNFSSGGWNRGIIPYVQYTVSNDLFDKSVIHYSYDGNFSGMDGPIHVTGVTPGNNVFMQSFKTSIRGYIMRPVPSSGIYPRFGAGFDIGYSGRIGISDLFSSSGYAYIYGYLPGMTLTQGVKITGRYQHQFESDFRKENAISIIPRGFTDSSADVFIRNQSRNHMLATIDYAIPIWVGDISWLCPLFYIKNFEFTPHFDYSFFSLDNGRQDGGLYSAGATFTARLANFIWLPYDCSIGFSFDFNGGKSYNQLDKLGYNMERTYIGMVFNLSL